MGISFRFSFVLFLLASSLPNSGFICHRGKLTSRPQKVGKVGSLTLLLSFGAEIIYGLQQKKIASNFLGALESELDSMFVCHDVRWAQKRFAVIFGHLEEVKKSGEDERKVS